MSNLEKRLAILEVLLEATGLMRPKDIGKSIGLNPFQTGKHLYHLELSGLVRKPGPKIALYEITDKGRAWMKSPPKDIEDRKREKEPGEGTGERTERKDSGKDGEKEQEEERKKGAGKGAGKRAGKNPRRNLPKERSPPRPILSGRSAKEWVSGEVRGKLN
jgi:hypothetical protein